MNAAQMLEREMARFTWNKTGLPPSDGWYIVRVIRNTAAPPDYYMAHWAHNLGWGNRVWSPDAWADLR